MNGSLVGSLYVEPFFLLSFSLARSLAFLSISQIWQTKCTTYESEGAHHVWTKSRKIYRVKKKWTIHEARQWQWQRKCVHSLLSHSRIRKWNFRWLMSKNSMRLCMDNRILVKHKTWLSWNQEKAQYWRWNGILSYGSGVLWLIIMIYGDISNLPNYMLQRKFTRFFLHLRKISFTTGVIEMDSSS